MDRHCVRVKPPGCQPGGGDGWCERRIRAESMRFPMIDFCILRVELRAPAEPGAGATHP